MQAVDADDPADLFDIVLGGDELVARGEVHAEVARVHDRRAGDAQVDFLRARSAELVHLGLGGGAADDRVVDDDDALALDHFRDHIELEANRVHTLGGRRLDEGPTDIAVGDDPLAVRQTGSACEARRSGPAGVGHGQDGVGIDRGFLGEALAEALADALHRVAEHHAGLAGEIDMLEHAVGPARDGLGEATRAQARIVDGHDLARLDLTHELGSDHIKGDGLAGQHIRASSGFVLGQATDDQGAPAPRIAGGLDAVLAEQHNAEGALEPGQCIGERILGRLDGGHGGDELEHHLRIAGTVEGVTGLFEFTPDFDGVGDIAVVGDGDRAAEVMPRKRLGVRFGRGTRGGIPVVPDPSTGRADDIEPIGGEFVKFLQILRGEYIGHQPHSGAPADAASVGGHDPCGLLPTVLEAEEPEVGEPGRVGGAPDAEDAAFLFGVGGMSSLTGRAEPLAWCQDTRDGVEDRQ